MTGDPPVGDPMTGDPPALRIAPPAFLAEPAFIALLAALPDARVVGGAVRDALAGARSPISTWRRALPPDAVHGGTEACRHPRRADRP